MNKANEDNLSFRGRELRHPAPTRAEARRQHVLGYVSNTTYGGIPSMCRCAAN